MADNQYVRTCGCHNQVPVQPCEVAVGTRTMLHVIFLTTVLGTFKKDSINSVVVDVFSREESRGTLFELILFLIHSGLSQEGRSSH